MTPDDPRHGTTNGYKNLGCRCVPCRDAHTASHKEWRHRSGYSLPAETWKRLNTPVEPPHGTESRYCNPWKCRCRKCKNAARDAKWARRQANIEHERELDAARHRRTRARERV